MLGNQPYQLSHCDAQLIRLRGPPVEVGARVWNGSRYERQMDSNGADRSSSMDLWQMWMKKGGTTALPRFMVEELLGSSAWQWSAHSLG